jgi:hypothetical protein
VAQDSPESQQAILKELQSINAGLIQINAKIGLLEESDKRTRRRVARTIAVVAMDLLATLVAVIAVNSAHSALDAAKKSEETQVQSCVKSNQSRAALDDFFAGPNGLFTVNLQQLDANPTHAPANLIAQERVLVQQFITKSHDSFNQQDCNHLKP